MSRQLRIAAVALGVVAIWWILWKVVDFERAPASRGDAGGSDSRSETIASDPKGATEDAQLAADARETLGSPAPATSPALQVEEPPPGPSLRLFGFLTDERTQRPLSDATLRLVDSGWEDRTAHSDASGEYAFENLQPGTWELTVESLARRTMQQSVDLVPEEPERRLDLALAPGEIVKVRVVGSPDLRLLWLSWRARRGTEPQGARLEPIVTLTEPSGWVPSDRDARGAEVGRFIQRTEPRFRRDRAESARADFESLRFPDGGTVDDLPPEYCGAFALSKPLPVFASVVLEGLVLQTRAVPPGTDEVTFELAQEEVEKLLAQVRLRVVDGDTESPPGWVHVALGQRLAGRRGTRTESDGTVVFEDVLPGTENLSIMADDREIVVERVVVEPGKTTDLGLFRLRPLARILGKVVDDAGEPAQVGFNVFPFDRYAATREALAKRIFRSSPEGSLKIDSVGHGRYLILANEEGWVSTPVLADTTLGDHEDLVIHVSKGTPVALRLRADPLPGARLEIRTRTGLPVADRNCRNRDPMKFVLVPGTYSIELWDGENWLASETLAVGTEPVRLYFPR